MQLRVELTEHDLRQLVLQELQRMMPEVELTANDVTIETKSKQNYKSEWESAAFRASVTRITSA